MNKEKVYMTVGELAKRMNTTVRTLQYYDKEGLLSPSAESEGGRRLYTDRDIVALHQIQSLKYLGFSLTDIKTRLVSLETPEQVAEVLSEQAELIKEKITSLSEVLGAVEKLRDETRKMREVDFKKYADIVVNLQLNNEFYWLIKHFDDKMLDHLRGRFTMEKGKNILSTLDRLCDKAILLNEKKEPPESTQGQELAKEWWDMVNDFTGGDMSLLPGLMKFAEDKGEWGDKLQSRFGIIEGYIAEALGAYFTKLGYNPLEGKQ